MTKYSHRGKGYMKELLDFSYKYCQENGFDFLFLVPAETSLFDYYAKCGFDRFGISRKLIFDGTTPENRENITELVIEEGVTDLFFDTIMLKNSCVIEVPSTIEDFNVNMFYGKENL